MFGFVALSLIVYVITLVPILNAVDGILPTLNGTSVAPVIVYLRVKFGQLSTEINGFNS